MKRGFIRYSRYRQIKRDWKGNRDWIEEWRMEWFYRLEIDVLKEQKEIK